ncbi:MAG: hypothetical protein ABFC12_03245 [Methanobacterium sp.]
MNDKAPVYLKKEALNPYYAKLLIKPNTLVWIVKLLKIIRTG